jgi:hypothetical protein
MGDVAKMWSVRHLLRVSDEALSGVVPDTAGTPGREWLACLTPHTQGNPSDYGRRCLTQPSNDGLAHSEFTS